MKTRIKQRQYKSHKEFHSFLNEILSLTNGAVSKIDYYHKTLSLLKKFSGCDCVELWLNGGEKYNHYHLSQDYTIQVVGTKYVDGLFIPLLDENLQINSARIDILRKQKDSVMTVVTKDRSNSSETAVDEISELTFVDTLPHGCLSCVMIPLVAGEESVGLLELMSGQRTYFDEDENEIYQDIAKIIAIALVNHNVQAALIERVKELSCLYSISQIAAKREISLGDSLQQIVNLIPPAWQYPDITRGRIILDDKMYVTHDFQEHAQRQKSDIIIKGELRGSVEVFYLDEKPEISEGPFLQEERNVIDTIARQIALLVERREYEQDRLELEKQLRHADRLATIGQLAAGVAHELNEPLGNILGFSQLAKKTPDIPQQTIKDLERIIEASLHSREIIKKLMLFARQTPPKKTRINLNKVVEEGLFFFEERCAKVGIELIRKLSPDIPDITGDQAQLNQVLVNLVVNSIQAMPGGGKLIIKTIRATEYISLIVEDNGIGMSDEVLNKIFIPFFTTKEVNEGTGLGLAVVHGIISSHKGKIKVESTVNQGTRFEIQFKIDTS